MVSLRGLKHGGWWAGMLFLLALSGCRIFEVPEVSCEEDSEWVGPCPVDPSDGGDGGGTGTDGGGTGTDGGGTGTDGGGTGTDGGGTGTDAGTGSDGGTRPDAGTSVDAGTGPDGGTFPGPDGGTFPGPDGGTFPGPDGGTFPGPDGGSETDGGDDSDGGSDGGNEPDGGEGPDGGEPDFDGGPVEFDGGPLPTEDDAGVVRTDAGTKVDTELPVGGCADDLCLRHKYAISSASDGFNGLWIFDPYDVYLAHTEGAQVVKFNDGFAPTAPMGTRPYQLHGTTPDNLWAISPAQSGPVQSPVSRFDGYSWATIPVPNTGPSIRPPALFTGPEATWVAGSHGGALRWDGATWRSEPPSGTARGTLQAFWSNTPEPLFAVGGVRATEFSAELGAYWQRLANGTWAGPTPIPFVPALRAISGPGTDHLYAVGGQAVLRWSGTAWAPEPLPTTLPADCKLSEAQDVWVKWDGSDVWVTFDTACVLRKKDGAWSAKLLPVPASFQARQVEGFNEADGSVDLWLTGYQAEGLTPGAAAYHFTLTVR